MTTAPSHTEVAEPRPATQDDTERPSTAVSRNRERFKRAAPQYALLLAFVTMIAVFGALRPDAFLSVDNVKSVLDQAAPLLVVSLGLTVVLVMEDFDLSFGGMIGLGGAVAVVLMVDHGMSWGLACLIALLVGLVGGAINGFLVAFLGGSSFIITLAAGTVFTGFEYAVTGQATIVSGIPDGFGRLAQDSAALGLTNEVYIAFAAAILVWVILERTELGRFMYAIGGNPEAARLSGLRTRELRLLGFAVVGFAAAATGLLLTSTAVGSAPTMGIPFLLPAFAAVFLGSAAFRVGQFNVPGTVLGVLFLGTMQTGLTMLALSTAVVNIVQGGILAAAILLSRLGTRVA